MLTEEQWELDPGRWVVSTRGEDGSVITLMEEDGWDGIRRLNSGSDSQRSLSWKQSQLNHEVVWSLLATQDNILWPIDRTKQRISKVYASANI